jgi:hypothetical protein
MARFDAVRYMPLTSDGGDLDVFGYRLKNVRFNVPVEKEIILKASDAYNLPGIAYTYLGDASMWHILLDYNGLDDSVNDIVPGLKLRIPQRAALIAYMESNEDVQVTLRL